MAKNTLLTGVPGVGKTTLVRRAVEASGMTVAGGFYTEEIREKGRRAGFRVRTLDGRHGVLAHVNSQSPYRVSRYGVNVGVFDTLGVSSIETALQNPGLIVIDEIGRMELFSKMFQEAVVLALGSDHPVFGVIQQRRGGFLDAIRARADTNVIEITEANRTTMLSKVLAELRTATS